MTDGWEAFVPFVSRLQLERVRAAGARAGAPQSEAFQGAMLFLDIVGFSTVTERLRAEGPKGAELLSGILDAYFRPLLDTIRAHGGDVLFFAGDAVGVLWKASSDTGAALEDAALRAAQCALDLQALVATIVPPWGSALRFRAALGAGRLRALEVGGVDRHWVEVVGGEALERVRRADKVGAAGTVVLDAEYLGLVDGGGAQAAPVGDSHFRLDALHTRVDPRPLGDAALDAEAGARLRGALPGALADRIGAGGGDFLAEFRQVTVAFTKLLDPVEDADGGVDLATLHRAVVAAQERVGRLEGVVYQVLEDDKGTELVVAFGLPGTSHSDDAARALLAAREIQEALRSMGLSPTTGVATGTLYCGPHGGAHRRRYAVIGSTMNLAARLMTMAGDRGVLCDDATRKLARRKFAFREAGQTTPKGFLAPIKLFAPAGVLDPGSAATSEHAVVGRAEEIAAVGTALEAVQRDGISKLAVIRADAGMGKSTILGAVMTLAAERSLHASLGAADSLETGTAYFAFRAIARAWVGIERGDAAPRAFIRAQAVLADTPDLQPLTPLLGGILGFDFPSTAETQQLRGQARANAVREMLLHAAVKRTDGKAAVLAIEDGHWMDAASWSLLSALLERVPRMLVVLTTRPMERPPAEFQALVDRDDALVLDLLPFGRRDVEAMTKAQLGVTEVTPGVLDFVARRAEGNPLFAREILRSLAESGAMIIEEGRADLASDGGAAATLPSTLEGVITSRIDRLSHAAQTTVKVAAVLGRSFETELLLGIHPARPDRATLEAELDALRRASLLTSGGDGDANVFDHALTHEAAYNLLTFANRETLHRSAAEQLEVMHAGNLQPVHARLGYHFRMGQLPDRAVPHMAAAGEQAIDAYASRDAIALLTETLTLDEQVRGPLRIDFNRARWCRFIGQAYYNGDLQAEAANWYRRSIALAGAQPRSQVLSATATLLRAVLAPGSVGGTPPAELDADTRARLIEGLASIYELTVVHLWENAMPKVALCACNAARVARRLGPSQRSADANSTLGYLVSMVGAHAAGERITLRAVEMADSVGDVQQLASVTTAAGMVHTQNGKPHEGLALLQRADAVAATLRAGMFRHRPKYMLADTLAWLGRYTEARPLFERAAELSRGAEHHVVGLATAMVALTQMREGDTEAAVRTLESPDGLAGLRESKMVMSIIVGLGVIAEARLELGDRAAALDAVLEAERWMSGKADSTSYFASVFGHSAIAHARLDAGEPGEPQRFGLRRLTPLEIAMSRMRSVRAKYPAARAPLLLLEGRVAAKQGRTRRARRLLGQAVESAAAHSQPFELGRSLVELAKLSPVSARSELLARATRVFEEHGMVRESERARAVMTTA